MIGNIEMQIVKDGVCITLRTEEETREADYDSKFDSQVVVLLIEAMRVCGIDLEYVAKKIEEQARWDK